MKGSDRRPPHYKTRSPHSVNYYKENLHRPTYQYNYKKKHVKMRRKVIDEESVVTIIFYKSRVNS